MKYKPLLEGRYYYLDAPAEGGDTQRTIMNVSGFREPTIDDVIKNLQKAAGRVLTGLQSGVNQEINKIEYALERVMATFGTEYLKKILRGDEEFIRAVESDIGADLEERGGNDYLFVEYAQILLDNSSKDRTESTDMRCYRLILTDGVLIRSAGEGLRSGIIFYLDEEKNLPPKKDVDFLVRLKAASSIWMTYQWYGLKEELSGFIDSIYETMTPDEIAKCEFSNEGPLLSYLLKAVGALQRTEIVDEDGAGLIDETHFPDDTNTNEFLRLAMFVSDKYMRNIEKICKESGIHPVAFIRQITSQN